LAEICARYGLNRVERASAELLRYSEDMMRAFLTSVRAGHYSAEDLMDNDGIGDKPVRIAVKITFSKRGTHAAIVDFTGSDAQVQGSINAVEAITWSAVFYVFRCLLADDVPATAGLLRPITVIAPEGTVVNARPPAAVAGGNVEMSQRIVDVLLRALAQAMPERIPAGAAGTMTNITVGGVDPRTGEPFAYYETVAGGMGARPNKAGVSGVHTHMTNSLNTPAEALEYAYPFRVTEYSLRRGSGGSGQHRGGDGIVRELELLTDAEVSLLSDRREHGPYGLAGGEDGQPATAQAIRTDGSSEPLPAKGSRLLHKGDRVRIETPGGGGHGTAMSDAPTSR
jgi:N-methylhydantoinase B